MEGVGFGVCMVVFTDGCTTTKVRGQPSDGVVCHCGVVYVCEEVCVVDGVEGLGEVHCHRHRAMYGVVLIKSGSYLLHKRQKSISGWSGQGESHAGCPRGLCGGISR